MKSDEIKSVVIVGGGTAGWMTAAALVKVLGPRLNITLIESDDIGTVGVGEATIPPIILFNNLMRIDEDEFMKATKATIKLGIEFVDWYEKDQAYMHDFGAVGKDLAYIGFHHYWMNAHLEKRSGFAERHSLWDYSFNNHVARLGKFARMPQIPDTPLLGTTYAFHFDAGLYAQYLRQLAEKMGVKRIEGKIIQVDQDPEKGDIARLHLENGMLIDGELFIDCSGFRGLLIEETLKSGYENWQDWLPCDRALALPCEAVKPTLPYTRSTAHKAGWQWRIPLQHRTGNGHVYASAFMSDDEALDILLKNIDGKALGQARPIKFVTGRRKLLWHKNCIAMGLAGGFIEPLESTSIHLIQSFIQRLILLFPHKGDNNKQRDEFNQASIAEFEFIRDFIILHYHANNRVGEPFWDMCRHMSIPDSLAHKIDLFKESGVIMSNSQDLFQLPSWLQVMWGQGITPRAAHAFVQAVAPHDRADYMKNIKDIFAHTAKSMPSHDDFLKTVSGI